MRRITITLGLALLALMGPRAQAPARADETGATMADAAGRFLAALDDAQKARAAFPFDSPERLNWHWIPRERNGLPFKALTPEQRPLAFGLLETGLSIRGMLKATTIMSLEEVLRVQEHGTGPVRDPELYFLSVFGTPGDDAGWGWRVEGHHLALNYTLKGDRVVSATPFMFGSNPAAVQSGSRKGLRNLAEIEAPVDALLHSLTPDQLKLAVVSPTAPEVTTTPNSARLQPSTPEGIAAEKLDGRQRAELNRLVRAYAVNFPGPIAKDLLTQIKAGEAEAHFAWSGPPDRTKPHAFRIQSPTIFIDFNDTQNGVNHIHTFFRSVPGDFGLEAAH